MENSAEYQSAKKRVETKMGFYTHLLVYVSVMLLLAAINLLGSSETIWFHWPLFGWGLAVVIHAFSVFVFPGQFAVTDKMIEKEMSKANLRN